MPRWIRAVVVGVPPVVVLVLVCLMALPFCATCGDHEEAVTAVIKQCKRATQLLGDDAHPARMGIACGSTKTAGGNGTASWSLPYTGTRERGTVSFDAVKRGGVWHVDRATLEVGDEVVDLVACASAGAVRPPSGSGGQLSQTNADAAQATFAGKVIRSSHPTVAVGRDCTGTLERERGSPSAHVRVTCGADVAYDGRGTFSLDVRDVTRRDDDHLEYDDSEPTSGDRPPRCRVSVADGKGTLTVWSTAPAWEIAVEL